ncbi:hypothetical protein GCM10027284_19330 [Cyclobacterium sediminis]
MAGDSQGQIAFKEMFGSQLVCQKLIPEHIYGKIDESYATFMQGSNLFGRKANGIFSDFYGKVQVKHPFEAL